MQLQRGKITITQTGKPSRRQAQLEAPNNILKTQPPAQYPAFCAMPPHPLPYPLECRIIGFPWPFHCEDCQKALLSGMPVDECTNWFTVKNRDDMSRLWAHLSLVYAPQLYEAVELNDQTHVYDCTVAAPLFEGEGPHSLLLRRLPEEKPALILFCNLSIENARIKVELWSLAGTPFQKVHLDANDDMSVAKLTAIAKSASEANCFLEPGEQTGVRLLIVGVERELPPATLLWTRAAWGKCSATANVRLQALLRALKRGEAPAPEFIDV